MTRGGLRPGGSSSGEQTSAPGGRPPPPGGKHPTGMLSCFVCLFIKSKGTTKPSYRLLLFLPCRLCLSWNLGRLHAKVKGNKFYHKKFYLPRSLFYQILFGVSWLWLTFSRRDTILFSIHQENKCFTAMSHIKFWLFLFWQMILERTNLETLLSFNST